MKDRKKSNIVWTVFFLATLLSLAAAASAQNDGTSAMSGEDGFPVNPALSEANAINRGEPANPSLYELRYACQEIVGFFPMDVTVARKWVPHTFNLKIDAQGMAQGAVVFLYCPDYLVMTTPTAPPFEQGQNLAPATVVHLWVILNGPAYTIPVPGAQLTTAVNYAYAAMDLVTDDEARRVLERAGKNVLLIAGATLTDSGKSQHAEILFLDGTNITIDAFTPVTLPAPFKLGSNWWLYHVEGDGANDGVQVATGTVGAAQGHAVNTARVQFLGLLPGPPNSTQVTYASTAPVFADVFGFSATNSIRGLWFKQNNIVMNGGRGELAWTTYPLSPIPVPPAFP